MYCRHLRKHTTCTHCRVPLGAYCEVHNENDPSNTTQPRTSRAIYNAKVPDFQLAWGVNDPINEVIVPDDDDAPPLTEVDYADDEPEEEVGAFDAQEVVAHGAQEVQVEEAFDRCPK
jgi:hypothetical protein